ncbi:MAG: hypothetical protein UU48_C0005G0008 [Candidatus Uhrbacteria bacterium GW2011_GWF2_41_16]|jgi:cytoskeletal protein CcmA (bactofilin family)|uniref:Integral membrane protein CcmA involved in cell shape determination n=2 Tax=Candidatus Uhriibacteriota TaxID=1752732 RepID=A0A0G0YCW6_9BACT|nr:MAG: hypothetical protein UU31_C0001G0009 [Candidatus Uhrbacteria bacterium GW2011_GWA2_41_10]KKR87235.1 MAG: hypothetical protein UU35_C0004G0008 [Candidatus Uhrbacteria bacterium GW2011_GWC2_41_11]KKR98152.1 MAG: hypothetical protein UU48_C0005G0008 [Candidatus Uhrbacteria bacterium GW2011_GWF2_41_16]HBP00489.1 hypothetical protein [Candidatus Uhrbacteria bacterium]
MFQRTDTTTPTRSNHGGETIIAQGVKVEGDFTSDGNVVIEGEVTGNVQTSQHLHVGTSAKIRADVVAQDAVIAGEVRGNLSVTGKLDLLETSRVYGDISVHILSVAAGAQVNGKLTMSETDSSEQGNRREEKVRVEEKS